MTRKYRHSSAIAGTIGGVSISVIGYLGILAVGGN